jgi:hypothetical protein
MEKCQKGERSNMNTIHYGIPVSSKIPVIGVVNTTAPEWLAEEISLHGIDLRYEDHCRECQRELHDDCYYNDGDTTYIIGYKKDEKGEFVPDLTADFSAIVNGNENTTQVTHSKWVSRAALCSPCYPGQGDLDNSGDYLAYTLPPDVWGSRDHLLISEVNSTLESIRRLYKGLYNTDRNTPDFATEFFYMVGDLLNGKRLEELSPAEPAAGTLRELLAECGGK